ncbi:MAG: PEP-utilizing enzyme [Aliishimia sp.]
MEQAVKQELEETAGGADATDDTLYPGHLRLDLDGPDADEFWFREDVHHPGPIFPFETIIPEAIKLAMGQINTRMLAFPMSNGIDVRVHQGRIYFSPVAAPTQAEAERRASIFERRTVHVFERFEDYEDNWRKKMISLTSQLRALPLPDLPDFESDARSLGGRALSSGHDLCLFYRRLVDALFEAYQYHFELLNIGYLGLLQFSDVFTELFPSANPATVNTMLKDGSLEIYEPERQICDLARLAQRLGVEAEIRTAETVTEIANRCADNPQLGLWYAALEAAREDWFEYSDGIGFSYFDRVWNDHPSIILNRIKAALKQTGIDDTDTDSRTQSAEDMFTRCMALIDDRGAAEKFENAFRRAQRVTPYLENHNLYVEHRFQSVFWRRLRELGGFLAKIGWLDEADDIVLLDRWALDQMIFEVSADWAAGTGQKRGAHWKAHLAAARTTMMTFQNGPAPVRFLGAVPDRIGDPIMICLFGITDEAIAAARDTSESNQTPCGRGASAGRVRGPVWIAQTADDVARTPDGAIVVCRILPPSWSVGLRQVGGVICEYGGVLSHAAILCREFGKPAVISVPDATIRFRSGEMVEMDGVTGIITRLANLEAVDAEPE